MVRPREQEALVGGRLSGKPHLSNAHHMVYFGSMVEVVDTIVSRAIDERRIGSSPI